MDEVAVERRTKPGQPPRAAPPGRPRRARNRQGGRGREAALNDVIASVSRKRRTPTLAARFNPARNNFDLLRIALAVLVVHCHCLSLKRSPWEPVNACLHHGYGGLLAVEAFLVIYVLARVARVLPGLALATLAEVFVIGPAFTKKRLWIFLT